MTTGLSTPGADERLGFRVDGMDCASCVGKIEVALARMPDVSDVRVNFTTETLELTLGAGALTKVANIEKTIKSLGFGVSNTRELSASSDAAIDVEPAPAMRNQRWWQTRKGKHVIGLGLLMGSAYVVAQFIPLYAEWIFAAAVIAGVIPFARKAFALATSGSPFSIETLMVVASIGALVIGEAEEAAAVVFLFAVGELLESVAAGRARAGIKALASLVPKTAVLLDSNGGQRTVPASALRVNDLVLVRPGDRVPADGQILQGTSSLDESPITGESVPRSKTTGESVFAGSINVDGVLQVSVEKTASDNTISRIIQLVEQAQSAKAPTARFIENFSRYYTPAVMLIAALIITVPPLAMNGDWDTWIYRGLALLLIACPCALGLAVARDGSCSSAKCSRCSPRGTLYPIGRLSSNLHSRRRSRRSRRRRALSAPRGPPWPRRESLSSAARPVAPAGPFSSPSARPARAPLLPPSLRSGRLRSAPGASPHRHQPRCGRRASHCTLRAPSW